MKKIYNIMVTALMLGSISMISMQSFAASASDPITEVNRGAILKAVDFSKLKIEEWNQKLIHNKNRPVECLEDGQGLIWTCSADSTILWQTHKMEHCTLTATMDYDPVQNLTEITVKVRDEESAGSYKYAGKGDVRYYRELTFKTTLEGFYIASNGEEQIYFMGIDHIPIANTEETKENARVTLGIPTSAASQAPELIQADFSQYLDKKGRASPSSFKSKVKELTEAAKNTHFGDTKVAYPGGRAVNIMVKDGYLFPEPESYNNKERIESSRTKADSIANSIKDKLMANIAWVTSAQYEKEVNNLLKKIQNETREFNIEMWAGKRHDGSIFFVIKIPTGEEKYGVIGGAGEHQIGGKGTSTSICWQYVFNMSPK